MKRILPVFLYLLLAATLRAQVGSEVEPNDTPTMANFVSTSSQTECTLTPADTDWFVFSIAAAGKVSMFVTAAGTTSVDTVMELYDAGFLLLAYNDDARGLMSDISVNLTAGTYFVKVAGFSATVTGTYSLDVAGTAPEIFTTSEAEPNDGPATAQALPQGNCRVDVDAGLSGPTDQDWYRVVLTAPRSGVWFLIDEGGTPWITQHRYEVYDSTGTTLVNALTLGTNAADNSTTSQRTSQIRCWPAGTYYLAVKNRSSTPPPTNKVLVGKYRLKYLAVPMNTGLAVAEAAEANNTPATATAIGAGDWGVGDLTAGDTDWWKVHTAGPSTLMVQTRAGVPTALTDSTIKLFDAKGTQLGATQFTGNLLDGNLHARMTVTLNFDSPSDFFVEVSAPAGPLGNYVLEVGLVPCTPYLTAASGKNDENLLCLGTATGARVEYSTTGTRELPVVGSLYTRLARLMAPGALLMHLQGFSDQFANGGAVPLPFDLTPLGAPNCSVTVDPAFVTLLFADGAGRALIVQPIPSAPVFLGVVIHEQVLVFDAAANPLGLTMSNSLWYQIGNRSF
jgi:hypothetical protein